jgi:hypothetical protein
MMTAAIVRVMLIADMVVMALLALVYLRQRRMSWLAYLGWGALAITVPVIGPFIVISNRPGEWDPSFSVQQDFFRLVKWLRRMLPEPTRGNSRLNRARARRQVRQQR